MRARLIACAALLCALPASGENAPLPQVVINALTPIDSMPSKSALATVFAAPLDSLRTIALDHSVDFGVELRAIRALPGYCPQAPTVCGPGTVVHDTLTALIDGYASSPHGPLDVLRLRAAVEALGVTRSRLSSDVDKVMPLINDGSRDVRVTVARALRGICNSQAIGPLNVRLSNEPTDQVRLAIFAALRDLRQCN